MKRLTLALAAILLLSNPAWAQVAYGPNLQIGTSAGTAFDGAAGAAAATTAGNAVPAAGGNASATNVTPTGGTVARTQAARAADLINVLDFGAVGDGVTDDTAAVQAALTAANGVAIAWIPPHTTAFRTKKVVLKSGDHLRIDGTLKLLDAAASDLISITSQTGVIVEGSGIIDGDKANAGGVATAPIACINSNNSSNIIIRGTGGRLKLQNCTNWPVNAWNVGSNVTMDDLETTSSGNSTECSSITHCYAHRLYMHDTGDYCWSFYGNVVDGVITDSTATKCGSGGFSALDDSGQKLPDISIKMANNTAYTNGGSGFSIYNTNGQFPAHQDVELIGNLSYGNNTGNTANYGGFSIGGCVHCLISSNQSHSNGNGTASSVGFSSDGHETDVEWIGNTSYDEGIGGGLGVGFGVSGADNRSSYIGNYAYDDQSTRTMAYGFNGTFQNNGRSMTMANRVGPTIGAGFNWTAGNDTVMCDINAGGLYEACNNVGVSGSIYYASLDAITPATITAPASGTAPTGATQFTKHISRVTTCSATQPMQLPAGAGAGLSIDYVLLNRSGSTCTIYPVSGGTIEAGAANVPVTVASGTDATFRSMSATAWYQ